MILDKPKINYSTKTMPIWKTQSFEHKIFVFSSSLCCAATKGGGNNMHHNQSQNATN